MVSQRICAPRVSIAIATYRRPQLLERVLRSLATQQLVKHPELQVQVLVVDNDEEASASPVIERMRSRLPFGLLYSVEPQRGISHARNRLIRMSSESDFIVFLDDDQEAESKWLDELIDTQQRTNGDIVLGRLDFVFEQDLPPHLAPLYKSQRDLPNGAEVGLNVFRAGNLLIRLSLLENEEEVFDPAFGLTGGEDSHFARRMQMRGIRFYWAESAAVSELYPSSRISLSWLLRRHYRTGTTAAAIDRRLWPVKGRILRPLKGVGSLGAGVLLLLPAIVLGRDAAVLSLCRMAKGIGSLAGSLGATYREYQNVHGS